MTKDSDRDIREDPQDVVYWTRDEYEQFLAARSPSQVRICELERDYALEKGGLVLRVFEQAYGYLFGKPWIKKETAVAENLGITPEEVEAILAGGPTRN